MPAARPVDVAELFRLWHSDLTNTELCERLGLTGGSLWSLRKKYGLPIRKRVENPDRQRRPDDPTPEEIAERAAECRARRSKDERERMERSGRQEWRLPSYAFDSSGRAFACGTP